MNGTFRRFYLLAALTACFVLRANASGPETRWQKRTVKACLFFADASARFRAHNTNAFEQCTRQLQQQQPATTTTTTMMTMTTTTTTKTATTAPIKCIKDTVTICEWDFVYKIKANVNVSLAPSGLLFPLVPRKRKLCLGKCAIFWEMD